MDQRLKPGPGLKTLKFKSYCHPNFAVNSIPNMLPKMFYPFEGSCNHNFSPGSFRVNLENSRSKPGVSMFDVIGEFSHMSSLQESNKLGVIPSPWPDTCGMKVGTCKTLSHLAGAKKCILHGNFFWPKRIWAIHQQNIMDPTSFSLRIQYSKLNLGSQLSY